MEENQRDDPGRQPDSETGGCDFPQEHGHRHEHYQNVINRLARIEGHVRGVKKMVENDVACPDILIQIAAIRSALNSVGRVILEDHITSCIVESAKNDDYDKAIRDLQISLSKLLG